MITSVLALTATTVASSSGVQTIVPGLPVVKTNVRKYTLAERYCSEVSGTGAVHVNALERFDRHRNWHLNAS